MPKLYCPVCVEEAERGAPRGLTPTFNIEPARTEHRHKHDRELLCPVMTSTGYQPALPEKV